MRNVRGGNLRPIRISPDPQESTTPDPQAMSAGSVDDLMALPDAHQEPMAISPDHESSAEVKDPDDLNNLPDANGSLGKIYDDVYHGDPDNVAKVLDTSKKLGADPAMVAGSLKDASKAANAPDPNFFRSIEERYPGTTKFLQDPKNMAVAHDDMPNLAQSESLVDRVKDAFNFEKNALTGGSLQEELSFLQYQKMNGATTVQPDSFRPGGIVANEMGAPTSSISDRIGWLQSKLDEINKQRPGENSSWIKRGLYGTSEFLPQIAGGVGYGTKLAAPAGAAALALGAATGPADVAVGAAAAGMGFTAGEAEYNYKLMTGMSYDTLDRVRDVNGQPLPDETKRVAATLMGAAAAGLSLVKLDAVLGVGGKKVMQMLTEQVPKEVLENQATRGAAIKAFAQNYMKAAVHGTAAMGGIQAVNVLGERGAEAASGQQFDHTGQPSVGQQIGEGFLSAGEMMPFMALPGAALGLHADVQAAKHAETAKNFYLAMGDTAEASKLRQRMPEAHQEFINGLTADGPVENVYIPQEQFASYFQSKQIDPEAVAHELGIDDGYKEAVQTGGDVKIPLDVWASRVAGTEHYQGLADDIKFNPDDLTARQVEDRKALIREQIKQTEEQAKSGAEPQGEDSGDKVFKERYDQMIAAGMTPFEARAGATLHEQAFRTLGERMGVDPYELAQRYQLEIRKREGLPPEEMPGRAFDEKTEAVGAVNPHGEIPSELPSHSGEEQKFIENMAALNNEIDGLKAESSPENEAKVQKLEGKKKELMQQEMARTKEGGRFYQTAQAPVPRQSPLGFYSQLEHEVDKMDFKQMPAKDLASRINNIQGLKKEEIEWSGLPEWLKAKEKDGVKVSKEEVQQFLRDNGVKVEQVVKGNGEEISGADWSEPERDNTGDSDDINSEMDYYVSQPEDAFGEEALKEWRSEIEKENTDDEGNVDEQAVERDLNRKIEDEAYKRAQEYVESEDYHGARYTVEEQNTGYNLHGSNEIGWYSPDMRDGDLGNNLEEAKIQLLAHLIEKGKIEGKQADLVRENDIKWDSPTASEAPSKAMITRRAKTIIKNDRARLEAQSRERYPSQYEPDKTPEEQKKSLDEDVQMFAREEAEAYYNDHTNPKNTVKVSIDHPILNGSIVGNDKNGYSLNYESETVENNRHDLEAKNLEDAKKEAIQKMIAAGDVKPSDGMDANEVNKITGPTKWGKYVVPGGENYREVLLTLPNIGEESGDKFQYTTHFNEKNILAHVRMTDRVDAEGRKTLFIEEMQSDWHQKGRESGYSDKSKLSDLEERSDALYKTLGDISKNLKDRKNQLMKEAGDDPDKYRALAEGDKELGQLMEQEAANEKEHTALSDQIDEIKKAVPDAPFKNTDAWAAVALKRMLRMAAEQGYEALAWSPADVHVDRWGTDNVSWVKKEGEGFEVVNKKTGEVTDRGRPLQTKDEVQAVIDKYEDPENYEVRKTVPHWLVGSAEQRGGNADGVNIEELARQRGELLERRGERVTSKDELRKVIADTLGRERNDRSLESLTDRVWKQMQGENEHTGAVEPRKEGMEFFYNKMIPDIAKKILKKLDPEAKIEVGSTPIEDEYKGEQGKMDMLEIPLTDKVKEKLMAGQSLFQPGEDQNGPQGRITFQREKAVIDLFKTANRSTFLHETGHYFLEVMQSLAAHGDAPQQVKDDMEAIRQWMGLREGQEIGVKEHEQFARGFEAYLREGKAPSDVLRRTFQKFKQWLLQIYKSVRQLHVELSPEIRSVMDRMLATDEEINNAHREVGFDQATIGQDVTPEMREKMHDLAARSREQAESTLLKEQMKEIGESNQKFIKGEQDRLQAEGEEKANAEPVFQAQNDIQEAIGPRKDVLGLARRIIADKVKTKADQLNAVQFDIAAQVNGFQDAKDLANAMLEAESTNKRQQMIDQHVSEGMRPHANMMEKSNIKTEALRAIHNEHMTELLALERQIYAGKVNDQAVNQEVSRRQRLEARIAAAEAKEQAHQILSDKPIKDAGNFRVYTTAERNAAIKADAAVKRKEFDKAAEYKRQQMLNHALAAEALKNRMESEKAVDFLQKAAKRGGDLKDMPFAFNKQIDQLLERFGVKEKEPADDKTQAQIAKDMQAKGESLNDIANATGMITDKQSGMFRPESLQDFVTRQNQEFHGLQIPDSMYFGGAGDYRDLKMQDLRDLKDTVKMLTKLGKAHDRFLNEFIQITMKEAGKRLGDQVKDLIGAPYASARKLGEKFGNQPFKKMVDNISKLPNSVISTMVNQLTLCTYLDGGEKNGAAHDYLYRPLKQAEDRKFARIDKMREEVAGDNGLFAKFYDKKELAKYKQKVDEIDGNDISRENVLAMALNWGNEQNRDRIRMGFGSRDGSGRLVPMSDDTIQGLFKKHLGKKDWDFAQAVWDHLETYWPEIASLEMKIRGVEPERVVPSPFENEHGSYKGGYYPISYDPAKADEAFKNQQQLTEEFQQYSAASAQTNRGHAIARVSFVSRPVRLDLGVFFNHLENVIHDLEFRPAVIDTWKFMHQPDVQRSLQDAIGQGAFRGMEDWLKAQGSSQSENLTWLDKALTGVRFGTTISALGMTPKAFLLHMPSNVFNSMWEIGVQNTVRMMTRAATDVAMGRGELKDFVFSRSEKMKQRLTTRDRDIMEMAKAWDGTGKSWIPHYAFIALHAADEAVSVPLWAEVYKQNVAEFGEAQAKDIADETVTRALGSGTKVDQIGFQRGSPVKKLFTMFYSWMSVMFNRAWLDGKIAGLEYNRGNVGHALAIMGKTAFWAWALPAVHEALLAQAMQNKPGAGYLPQNDEDKKKFVGALVEHPFAMIPFVRDIAQPAIRMALGEHAQDYKLSPVEESITNLFTPVAQGINILAHHDKHFDEKYAEEVARGAAQLLGYPQQLNTWAFNFLDYIDGHGEASLKDFLSRKRKK